MILKKLIRQMTITQAISELIVNICLIIDAIMIGQFLGVDSISAYGYSAPVILIFTAFSSMICTGSQVVCGRSIALGDKKETNSCFTSSIIFSILISLLGALIVFLFSNTICSLLGAGVNTPSNPIFGLTKDYIFGFIIGAPAFMIMQLIIPYLQLSGERKQILITTCIMSLSDILFNFLNIYVFKMGIFGMGLASALSYYVASSVGIILFIKKIKMFDFKLNLFSNKVIFKIIKNGLPSLILHVCLVSLPLIRNNILTKHGGSVAVAAYSVVSSIANIGYAPIYAVIAVIISLASIFYTDKDKKSLKESVKIILKYIIIVYSVILVISLIATKQVVMMFTSDLEAIEFASYGLRFFALSLIPCATAAVFGNFYQGIGKTKLAIVITFLQNFAISVFCAVAFSKILGVNGIWIGLLFSEIITLLFVVVHAFIYNKKISLKLDNLLLLPKDFGVNEKDVFNKSIKNSKDVIKVSKEAYDFCINHGLDKRKSYHIGLAIEELGNNIVKYGFIDKKNHIIDIRIVINKESIVLCIKDNCFKFDPIKYLELHQDDDQFAHLGIKMIMKLVKDANYTNTFGLNNLLLEL